MLYNRILILIASAAIFLASGSIGAQKTASFDAYHQQYYEAKKNFDLSAYAEAYDLFGRYLHRRVLTGYQEEDRLQFEAMYFKALSGLYSGREDAENELIQFMKVANPDPLSDKAAMALANHYFYDKRYRKALEYYAKIHSEQLSESEYSEYKFKQGYSYFVRKAFEDAIAAFASIRNRRNKYYYPSNYYYGLSHYFLEHYDEAISSFRRVEGSKAYKAHVPYYTATILSKQKKWDELLLYLEPRIEEEYIKNKKELHQLLGQAYFENKQYKKALPHLEYYERHSGKMRAEDFYQLGYTQYISGKYEAAKNNFLEISNQETELGQNANFYLADCYLKLKDPNSARNAFAKVNKYDFNPELKAEAVFHYGSLSAQLGDNRPAVNALNSVKKTSRYYEKAQKVLADVFSKTTDYANALEILENIQPKSPTLKRSYQKIAYLYGLQSLGDQKTKKAAALFEKSYKEDADKKYTSLSLYYLGYIDHLQNKYNESANKLRQFLDDIGSRSNSDEYAFAQYIQGYNYFQLKKYSRVIPYFKNVVEGSLENRYKNDAYIRLGDAYLKHNRYEEAYTAYQSSQRFGKRQSDYVGFQKAIIRGLQNRPTDKIILLNEMLDRHPESGLADDAYFELANTYVEIQKPNNAITTLKTLLEKHKQSPLQNKARIKLGLISYNQGDLRAALKHYSELLRHNPSKAESAEAIAAIQEIYIEDMKDPDGFESFLETFPAFKLGNAAKDSLNYRVAFTQYEDGNYKDATAAFAKYLKNFPAGIQRLDALFFKAEAHTLLKEYSKAFDHYLEIVDLGPSSRYEDALYKAAVISYNHNKDFEESYRLYNSLYHSSSDEKIKLDAAYNALNSAFRTDNEPSVLSYAQIIIAHPDADGLKKSTAHFYKGKIEQKRLNYADALSSYNAATKDMNNEIAAESRYQIAKIYYTQKQLDLTETYCQIAIEKSSSYPYWVAKNLILLSDVLRDKGDLFNARAALEAVIDNYKEDKDIIEEAEKKLDFLKSIEKQKNRIDRSDSLQLLQLKENE